jgi:hypothetical protein
MSTRDQIEAALASPDRIAALRAVALDLSGRGLSRRQVYEAFLEEYMRIQHEDRESEENDMGDVMDMICNTYHPHLNLPE